MKEKADLPPFGVLLNLYLQRVQEIADELGQRFDKRSIQTMIRTQSNLRAVIASTNVTEAMGLSMTALVMSMKEVDRADPIIARYAIEFAVEHRLEIAEVILGGDGQGRRGAY